MPIRPEILITALASLVGGGFAGAVYSSYVNRIEPTIITYRVTTTSIGADSSIKSLIPNLKLQVDGKDVSVVHTHTIEFAPQRGPFVDGVEVAITFRQPSVQIYGMTAEAPSRAHTASCARLSDGARCKFSPISARSAFRVSFGSNQPTPPTIDMAIRGVELLKLDDFLAQEANRSWISTVRWVSYILLALGLLFTLLTMLKRL